MIWRVIGIIPSWQICLAIQESGWAGTSRLNIKITWRIWQHVKKNDSTSKNWQNTEQNNQKKYESWGGDAATDAALRD